jgi:magnesium chelatase family protein
VARYQDRISGPLLDRIDMQIQVGALPHDDLVKQAEGEPSAAIGKRVERAFATQQARQRKTNSGLTTTEIDRHCRPDAAGDQLLRTAMIRLNWSARAYHRVLKVARTIADLDGSANIGQPHVAEAIQYRRALRER